MNAGFRYFAEKDPDAVALVDPDGARWTRARLDALANRLARAFRAAGLAPGETLAIIAPNCAEYVAAYLAGLRAGLSIVPVNWHLSETEIAFLLDDSDAAAVIVHARIGSRLLASIVRHCARAKLLAAIGDVDGGMRLDALASRHSDEPFEDGPAGRMMAYTSATTGEPKAVKLPSANADAALERIVRSNAALGIHPESGNVHLCASMLYHSAPLGGAEAALHMGHTLVLAGRWTPELLLRLIEAHGVTTTFMVPAMFVRLLKLPETTRARYSTASLRFVTHGAAPCPADVKRRMIEWWGPIIWESYGATEVQGTIIGAEEWLERPGSVGKPLPGSAVKILDERGRALPPHEVGLIYVAPHTGDRFEYRGRAAETRRCYHGEYVTVGDLGYVDDEGYLYICDRSTDLIISSGMNIYPAEIESLLVEHPAVADCAVVGEPHELLGEIPKAFVELEAGVEREPRLTADLLRFLGARLSAMKLPKRVEYVAEIPRDPNGKLYKRCLRGARRTPHAVRAAALESEAGAPRREPRGRSA